MYWIYSELKPETHLWAAAWQNKQNDVRPAKTQICASTQSDPSLRFALCGWLRTHLRLLHKDSEDWSNCDVLDCTKINFTSLWVSFSFIAKISEEQGPVFYEGEGPEI